MLIMEVPKYPRCPAIRPGMVAGSCQATRGATRPGHRDKSTEYALVREITALPDIERHTQGVLSEAAGRLHPWSRKRGRRGREESELPRGRLRRYTTRCSGDSKTRIQVEALKLEGTQGRSPGTLNPFFLVQSVNIQYCSYERDPKSSNNSRYNTRRRKRSTYGARYEGF
jgi:hypothetical protein